MIKLSIVYITICLLNLNSLIINDIEKYQKAFSTIKESMDAKVFLGDTSPCINVSGELGILDDLTLQVLDIDSTAFEFYPSKTKGLDTVEVSKRLEYFFEPTIMKGLEEFSDCNDAQGILNFFDINGSNRVIAELNKVKNDAIDPMGSSILFLVKFNQDNQVEKLTTKIINMN